MAFTHDESGADGSNPVILPLRRWGDMFEIKVDVHHCCSNLPNQDSFQVSGDQPGFRSEQAECRQSAVGRGEKRIIRNSELRTAPAPSPYFSTDPQQRDYCPTPTGY